LWPKWKHKAEQSIKQNKKKKGSKKERRWPTIKEHPKDQQKSGGF
jgi:hypothetical protein